MVNHKTNHSSRAPRRLRRMSEAWWVSPGDLWCAEIWCRPPVGRSLHYESFPPPLTFIQRRRQRAPLQIIVFTPFSALLTQRRRRHCGSALPFGWSLRTSAPSVPCFIWRLPSVRHIPMVQANRDFALFYSRLHSNYVQTGTG